VIRELSVQGLLLVGAVVIVGVDLVCVVGLCAITIGDKFRFKSKLIKLGSECTGW